MSQFTFSAPSPMLVATATYLGQEFSVTSLSAPATTVSQTLSLTSPLPSTTITNTPAAETAPPPSKPSTSPAATGAGVGVGVAAAILIAVFSLWCARRRKRRSRQGPYASEPAELLAAERRTEAPVEKYRAELMSDVEPQELHGETVPAKSGLGAV